MSIELIVEDDEANPAVGLTKSRKLIEKDGVHLMTGGLMASTAYAIAPTIATNAATPQAPPWYWGSGSAQDGTWDRSEWG